LIRFDKRGTGMSDRPAGVPDLETRIHDVLAVMDAAGTARAMLFGYSEGGAMATLFAATHPDRVHSLVLYGSYAKRTRGEDNPWAQTEDERRRYTDELVNAWDWGADARFRCPSADQAMQRWWARRMTAAATPSTVRALLDMNSLVDVRLALPSVRQPALVMHRRGDALFAVEEAEYLAAHLPNATLRLLEGSDHVPWGDADQVLDEIEAFIRALPDAVPVPDALAAVVAPAGPRADGVCEALVGAGGRLRTGPGGRPVVLFPGPATAVRAGLAQVRGSDRLGVTVAEVSRDAPEVSGPAVTLSFELADAAPPGSVWVSAPVRDLLAGSGVVTRSAGEHRNEALGPVPVFTASGG
jgi:pimeloyl-ACP methyl ester carboxylesterase